MWLIRTFLQSSRKQPKRLSHVVIETPIFHVGMRMSMRRPCLLLKETTRVWLLQLYFPKVTKSGGIELKQFGASNFHTLVVNQGVYGTFHVNSHAFGIFWPTICDFAKIWRVGRFG